MPWNSGLSTRSAGFSMTAAEWNKLIQNLNYQAEVNYTAYTADVAITVTTVATATQIVTSGPITYEAVPHLIEFYCPRVDAAAVVLNLILRDGTTVLGTFSNIAASAVVTPYYGCVRVTPTAASHTYNVAAWNAAAGTANFRAGTGGATGDSSTRFAGFIRITRVPT